MLVSTTPNVEGRRVVKYFGIVSGEAILGANIFKDLFAGIRDIVGGRSGAYEKELRRAKEIAFQDMEEEAKKLGAKAVLGVKSNTGIMQKLLGNSRHNLISHILFSPRKSESIRRDTLRGV